MQQPGVESAAESGHESQLVLERSDLAANLTANLTTLIGGGVSPRAWVTNHLACYSFRSTTVTNDL